MLYASLFIAIATLWSAIIACYPTTDPYYHISATSDGYQIDHVYGSFTITHPLVKELLEHPIMERVKHVHQYGFNYPFFVSYPYSRFDHCLGVFLLLTRFGAPFEEAIAGLLHDVSHTAGSHIAEVLFDHRSLDSSYQDDIHAWYLAQWGIDAVLAPYGLSINDILAKNAAFTALEQPNGTICADRLEYNLMGGLKEGMLSPTNVEEILSDLQFDNNEWYFSTPAIARRFAIIPLYHTEHIWGSSADTILYEGIAQLIKRALALGLVTLDDVHFGTDDQLLQRLQESNDPSMQEGLTRIRHYKRHFYLTTTDHATVVKHAKFRGIDPLVAINGKRLRLSHIDPSFADYYRTIQERMQNGWAIAFLD